MMFFASSDEQLPTLPARISDVPRHWAKETPTALALRDGKSEWNYRQLDNAIADAKDRLCEIGVRAGDRVVIVTPVWPNLVEIPRILGAEAVTFPLTYAPSGWTLDLGRLLDALTPGTRVVCINSPNNPTGWTISPDEQRAILRATPERLLEMGLEGRRKVSERHDSRIEAGRLMELFRSSRA